MLYLEIETREGRRRVTLNRERVSIGRLSYNDVVIPNAQVSRQHAEMRCIQGEWWIADLHSTNGLQINMQPAQEHRLAPGDSIVLAPDVTLRFLDDAPPPVPDTLPETPPWRAGHAVTGAPTPRAAADAERGAAPVIPVDAGVPPSPGSLSPPMPGREGGLPTLPARGGYPAPPGPLNPGDDLGDPYRRTVAGPEAGHATLGPAQRLLHVCQTCGQLTAPDAVYCQNCHHSIAYECANCHLSLLPIQDRCPRCQTPNAASVRRAHRGPTY